MNKKLRLYNFRMNNDGSLYLQKSIGWLTKNSARGRNFDSRGRLLSEHGLHMFCEFWRSIEDLHSHHKCYQKGFALRRELTRGRWWNPASLSREQLVYPTFAFETGDYVVIGDWMNKRYKRHTKYYSAALGHSDKGWVKNTLHDIPSYNEYEVEPIEFVTGIAGFNVANIERIFYRLNHLDFCFWKKYNEDNNLCSLTFCLPQYGVQGVFSNELYEPKAPKIVERDVRELNSYYLLLTPGDAEIYFSKTIANMLHK